MRSKIGVVLIISFLIILIFAILFLNQKSATGQIINTEGATVVCGEYKSETPNSAAASSTNVKTQSSGGSGAYGAYGGSGAYGGGTSTTEYPAKNAIDGNLYTYWQSSSSEKYPQWIYFSLGSEKCINSIKLALDSRLTPITMDVEISSDAVNWKTIVSDWTQTASSFQTISFNEVTGRYIRLYQKSGGTSIGGVSEVLIDNALFLVQKCVESDSGKDYNVKGKTEVDLSKLEKEDVCASSKTLFEQYCEKGDLKTELYTCPNACLDGACVKTLDVKFGPYGDEDNSNVNVGTTERGGSSGGSSSSSFDLLRLNKPQVLELSLNEKFVFSIFSEEHSISIESLTPTTAEIIFRSEPKKLILEIGKERTYDFNEDGYPDISFKLISIDIQQKKAEISIINLKSESVNRIQCILSPIVCPSDGKQRRICIDSANPSAFPQEELIRCKAGECAGCLIKGKCLPYGVRFRDYERDKKDKYCSIEGEIREQKVHLLLSPSGEVLEGSCLYNYECKSNKCDEGRCVSVDKIISNVPEHASSTARVLCKSANLFNKEEYESCVFQYLSKNS